MMGLPREQTVNEKCHTIPQTEQYPHTWSIPDALKSSPFLLHLLCYYQTFPIGFHPVGLNHTGLYFSEPKMLVEKGQAGIWGTSAQAISWPANIKQKVGLRRTQDAGHRMQATLGGACALHGAGRDCSLLGVMTGMLMFWTKASALGQDVVNLHLAFLKQRVKFSHFGQELSCLSRTREHAQRRPTLWHPGDILLFASFRLHYSWCWLYQESWKSLELSTRGPNLLKLQCFRTPEALKL